jgi:hypothetical protein
MSPNWQRSDNSNKTKWVRTDNGQTTQTKKMSPNWQRSDNSNKTNESELTTVRQLKQKKNEKGQWTRMKPWDLAYGGPKWVRPDQCQLNPNEIGPRLRRSKMSLRQWPVIKKEKWQTNKKIEEKPPTIWPTLTQTKQAGKSEYRRKVCIHTDKTKQSTSETERVLHQQSSKSRKHEYLHRRSRRSLYIVALSYTNAQ